MNYKGLEPTYENIIKMELYIDQLTAALATMTTERDEAREWLRVRTETKYKLEDEVERLQADLASARAALVRGGYSGAQQQ